jgi:hypothetical protein
MANNVWNSAVEGYWSNPNNWTYKHPPTATESALFNYVGTGKCIVDQDVTIVSFSMDSSFTGNFDDGGHTFDITTLTIITEGAAQPQEFKASGHWIIRGSGYCNIDHCGKLLTGGWTLEYKGSPFINLIKAQDIYIKRLITNTPGQIIKWESYYGYQIFIDEYLNGDWDNSTWKKQNYDTRPGWDYYNIKLQPSDGTLEFYQNIHKTPTGSQNMFYSQIAKDDNFVYITYEDGNEPFVQAYQMINGVLTEVGARFDSFSEIGTVFLYGIAAINGYVFVSTCYSGIVMLHFDGSTFTLVDQNTESTYLSLFCTVHEEYLYVINTTLDNQQAGLDIYRFSANALTLVRSSILWNGYNYNGPQIEGTNIIIEVIDMATGGATLRLFSTLDQASTELYSYSLGVVSDTGFHLKNSYIYNGSFQSRILKIESNTIVEKCTLTIPTCGKPGESIATYVIQADDNGNIFTFPYGAYEYETDGYPHGWSPLFTLRFDGQTMAFIASTTSKRQIQFPYDFIILDNTYLVLTCGLGLKIYKIHKTPKPKVIINNFNVTKCHNRSGTYTWKGESNNPIFVKNSVITSSIGFEQYVETPTDLGVFKGTINDPGFYNYSKNSLGVYSTNKNMTNQTPIPKLKYPESVNSENMF